MLVQHSGAAPHCCRQVHQSGSIGGAMFLQIEGEAGLLDVSPGRCSVRLEMPKEMDELVTRQLTLRPLF
jgi:hypothetical protein